MDVTKIISNPEVVAAIGSFVGSFLEPGYGYTHENTIIADIVIRYAIFLVFQNLSKKAIVWMHDRPLPRWLISNVTVNCLKFGLILLATNFTIQWLWIPFERTLFRRFSDAGDWLYSQACHNRALFPVMLCLIINFLRNPGAMDLASLVLASSILFLTMKKVAV